MHSMNNYAMQTNLWHCKVPAFTDDHPCFWKIVCGSIEGISTNNWSCQRIQALHFWSKMCPNEATFRWHVTPTSQSYYYFNTWLVIKVCKYIHSFVFGNVGRIYGLVSCTSDNGRIAWYFLHFAIAYPS